MCILLLFLITVSTKKKKKENGRKTTEFRLPNYTKYKNNPSISDHQYQMWYFFVCLKGKNLSVIIALKKGRWKHKISTLNKTFRFQLSTFWTFLSFSTVNFLNCQLSQLSNFPTFNFFNFKLSQIWPLWTLNFQLSQF